jgi:hypothetical protein
MSLIRIGRTFGQIKNLPARRRREARGGAPRRCPPYIRRREKTTNWAYTSVDIPRSLPRLPVHVKRFAARLPPHYLVSRVCKDGQGKGAMTAFREE